MPHNAAMIRKHFNPKRRFRRSAAAQPLLDALAERVIYTGSPLHKRNPGDFALDPPSAARADKTLCDEVRVFERSAAQTLLREDARRGLVSEAHEGEWPQNIWAVVANVPVEAQLENAAQGTYHGYPLQPEDPHADRVLARWGRP